MKIKSYAVYILFSESKYQGVIKSSFAKCSSVDLIFLLITLLVTQLWWSMGICVFDKAIRVYIFCTISMIVNKMKNMKAPIIDLASIGS